MIRKLCVVFLVLLTLSAVTCLAFADGGVRLDDGAGLLTVSEKEMLLNKLDEISARQNVDIVVVTVDNLGGEDITDYADDYFDYNGFGNKPLRGGALLLVAMDESEMWISTSEYCIKALTDAGIDYILDEIEGALSDGKYFDAFDTFAHLCDEFITQADSGRPYDRDNLPHEPLSIVAFFVCLAVGAAIGGLTVLSMKNELKSVRFKTEANSYVRCGSFNLTQSRDMFLYRHVSRRKRPESTGGGRSGGSSVHVGSSGRSHGGGGRSF